jgi:hypothetical protein
MDIFNITGETYIVSDPIGETSISEKGMIAKDRKT